MEIGAELRRSAVTSAGVDQRPDENTVRIQREHSDIRVEILPVLGGHEEVLLDIRGIEGGDECIVLFQVFTNGSKRRRSGEVSDNRYDQIVFLVALQCEEIV